MDYSIAIIVPSSEVSTSAKKALDALHFNHPVITASSTQAVAEARTLIPLGLRLIITHGITYQYLEKELDIPLLELPFGGLDVMATVQKALGIGGRIIHIGTEPFYHFIRRSLESLQISAKRIAFHKLNMEQTIDEQVLAMLDEHFDVFIGGNLVTHAAQKAGKVGIEFNVSHEIIRSTVQNARSIVKMMIRQEEDLAMEKAILQSTSEGLIVTDQKNRILFINPAAQSIFHRPTDELTGRPLQEAFEQCRIIDSDSLSDHGQLNSSEYTPVILKTVPITSNENLTGNVVSIKKVSEIYDLEYQVRKDLIVKGFVAKHSFHDIVGTSPALCHEKEKASIYAKYDSTILIYGETGTGKELFAQSIHNASRRKHQPFIAVNCAALPENLIESELFGYVKGAFTGANAKGKPGLFEQADKGTIFLDEISEIPVTIQSKLLRVLQEGDIIRIGGDKVIHVDIRIICSSNKNLLQLIEEGRFKNDLYYRLSTLEINIPPLRDRKSDIPALAEALICQYARKHHKVVTGFTPEVLESLSQMELPGNVRQLGNIIERMVILSDTAIVNTATMEKCDLPSPSGCVRTGCRTAEASGPIPASPKTFRDARKEMILDALEACGGNKTAAARMLGIHPTTLWRQLKREEQTVPFLSDPLLY